MYRYSGRYGEKGRLNNWWCRWIISNSLPFYEQETKLRWAFFFPCQSPQLSRYLWLDYMLSLVKKITQQHFFRKQEFISFLVRWLIGFLAWFWRDILVMRIEIGRSIGAATSPVFLDKYIVSCFTLMHTHTKKT
jgi:hypothetical protein